jgi:hypothetical protein
MTRPPAALIELHECIARDNTGYSTEHQLRVRGGMHWGEVLTDGVIVTGDAVNIAARVTGLAEGGEIKLSKALFNELPNEHRVRCAATGTHSLKGVGEPMELMHLQWRTMSRFPSYVTIVETSDNIMLPANKDLIRFGRLKTLGGVPANDIVLALPDVHATKYISRYQFELRRLPEGFKLRRVSRQPLEVNGVIVEQGVDVDLEPGAEVRLSGVMTLKFAQPNDETVGAGATLMVRDD